jgi:uncharacterized protein (DUF302 family)
MLLGLAGAAAQNAPVSEVTGLIVRESPHSVAETVTRLEGALEANGLTLVAVVEHDLSAANTELELPPTRLPNLGSPQAGRL